MERVGGKEGGRRRRPSGGAASAEPASSAHRQNDGPTHRRLQRLCCDSDIKEIKLFTFDAALAAALGFSPVVLHYVFMGLVSVTAVGAFDAEGSILVVALMIVPPDVRRARLPVATTGGNDVRSARLGAGPYLPYRD